MNFMVTDFPDLLRLAGNLFLLFGKNLSKYMLLLFRCITDVVTTLADIDLCGRNDIIQSDAFLVLYFGKNNVPLGTEKINGM